MVLLQQPKLKTCRCGYRDKGNRNGIHFQFKKCGYTIHADLNGAINIAKAISGFAA
ncbi:transposase [Geobacillus sp. TFV-3]|uniref:transposase n=1 Tax=Geobacillus sp. TFV-3 TaxID=1897059 RepID=UPI001F328F49|nr:transposase [Geobacillus sp. TFV-3]